MSKNIVAYRIECAETGLGFYNARNSKFNNIISVYDKICIKHNEHFTSIKNVVFGFISGQHFCAFLNLNALTLAISHYELDILINEGGFNVLKLTLSDALIGEDELQLAYKKEDIIQQKNVNNQILKILKSNI